MKYLKYFESILDNQQSNNLREFCENYLAYLIDEGFTIEIYQVEHSSNLVVEIRTPYNRHNEFNWGKAKDALIPFIQMLDKKYPINKSINFQNPQYNWKYNDLIDIKRDLIEDTREFLRIRIYLNKVNGLIL
jgi:hypothetical protein